LRCSFVEFVSHLWVLREIRGHRHCVLVVIAPTSVRSFACDTKVPKGFGSAGYVRSVCLDVWSRHYESVNGAAALKIITNEVYVYICRAKMMTRLF
jgi:hypothetical protein